MISLPARFALAVALPVAIAGCSTVGSRPETPDGDKCLQLYTQVDARVAAAGVNDAGYYRIPGFPYLRSDRYSASYAQQIPTMDAFWEWVGYLRANEDESREIELRNLKMTAQESASLLLDMRACGGWLRSWELEDAAFRDKLVQSAGVPDDYSTAQRAAGLYALTSPWLKRGAEDQRKATQADFAATLADPAAPSGMILWKPAINPNTDYEAGTIDLRNKPHDLLGRIGLLWSEVQHMAYTHAPALWIETTGDYDRPGTPIHTISGPDVDVGKPVVYFLPGLTRFAGKSLLQINYFVWFSEQVPANKGEGTAGTLDGLIWRVTFDDQGRPLMYDTIRATGSNHLGFLAQPTLEPRQAGDGTVLFPQKDVPAGALALRVRSGTHDLARLAPLDQVQGGKQAAYELRTYDELLTLPDPAGGTRSLFGSDGFIAGTSRSEPFWSWPSGVRNAGAIRQWGHHPTTPVGRAHFDDPYLLEQLFVVPEGSPAAPTGPVKGGVLAP